MNCKKWAIRFAKTLGSLTAATLLVAGGIYTSVQYDGNVHVVEPGMVIRAAQPTPARLDDIRRRYAIRSVVNLRGDNRGQPWYDDEIDASRAGGLAHFDYALSAEHDVSLAQMADVLKIIANAPKPVLVHCKAGADRTGLVSAIYELSRGVPMEKAGDQLSLHYGHFPYLWSKTDAMDRSLAAYLASRAALAAPGRATPS